MFHSLTTSILALTLASRTVCLVPAHSQSTHNDASLPAQLLPRSAVQPPPAFTEQGAVSTKRQADPADDMDYDDGYMKRDCSNDHDIAQDKRQDDATFIGKLQVTFKNGTILGFVGRRDQSYYVVDSGSIMRFNASASGLTPEINIFDQAMMFNSSFPNLGAVIPRGTNLTAGEDGDAANYALIAAVMTTEPDSAPQNPESDSDDPQCDVEAAIWIFDANSREVTAQWVGYDKEMPSTFIHFEPNEKSLILRGSECETCNNKLPVTLTLV